MVSTLQERIFVTEQYFAHKSYKTVFEMFKAKFPGKDVPNKFTMSCIIAKFHQRGTVCNLPYNREKTVLTPLCWQQCCLNWRQMTQELPNLFAKLYRSIAMKVYHMALLTAQWKPSDFIHTEFASYTTSPCDVLSMVTKLCINSPWHVERSILFWWSMVSTVTVLNSPAPANLETLKANITCEINKILRTILTNDAGNVVRRKRACTLAGGGGETTTWTFIPKLPHIFPCRAQFWFYIIFFFGYGLCFIWITLYKGLNRVGQNSL